MIHWHQCCGLWWPIIVEVWDRMKPLTSWAEIEKVDRPIISSPKHLSYAFYHLSPMLGSKLSPHRSCGDIPDENRSKRIQPTRGFVKEL